MMLASYPRRQHPTTFTHHLQPYDLPSPAPSNSSFFDNTSHSAKTSPLFNHPNIRYDSLQPEDTYATTPNSTSSFLNFQQSMSDTFEGLSNPSIRIENSTPSPLPEITDFPDSYVFEGTECHDWQYPQLLTQAFDQSQQDLAAALCSSSPPPMFRRRGSHQRAASASTVGSNGPSSPFTQTTSYPQIANPDQSPRHGFESQAEADQVSTWQFSKPLPTPTQTPTNDSFLAPPYQQFSNSHPGSGAMAAHSAMKQALMESNGGCEADSPGVSNSSRHSVSSIGPGSPATPLSSAAYDEQYHPAANDQYPRPVPNLGRTISAVYEDELYNPISVMPQQPAKRLRLNNGSTVSPQHNSVAHLQMEANKMRGQGLNGYNSFGDFRSPTRMLGNAVAAREHHQQQAQAQVHAFQHVSNDPSSQKTISPKEVSLDYHPTEEESQVAMFPDNVTADLRQNFQQSWPASQPHFTFNDSAYDAATERSHSSLDIARQPSNSSFGATAAPQSNFNFSMPAPFSTSSYRPTSQVTMEATPEFPAHLTTMESSASEAEPSSSQTFMSGLIAPVASGDSNATYSCTYHGCTQRFDSQGKLQKHKRDGHRSVHQPMPTVRASPPETSPMTSEAIAERNSQAGPHKCERINPSTGKPCNQIFSRPYDLTRHEDTIHNARKQKVRCALCTEDKTFSRNDALTRHMRVVHPEIDFPGKHRRRGVPA